MSRSLKLLPLTLMLACQSIPKSYARGGASTGGGTSDVPHEVKCELRDNAIVHIFTVDFPPSQLNSFWMQVATDGCSPDGVCPPPNINNQNSGNFVVDRLSRPQEVVYTGTNIEVRINLKETIDPAQRAQLWAISKEESRPIYHASGRSNFTSDIQLAGYCVFDRAE